MNFPDVSAYAGLIFDLDGTLINSMPWHVKAWQRTAKEHGFTIDAATIYAMGGVSSRDVVLHYQRQGKPVGDIEAFIKQKVTYYRENIDKVEVFAPVLQVLKDAHARGVKIAVGTGTQLINAKDILTRTGLLPLLDALVTCEDVQRHKPYPDTFLKAASKLGLKPWQCLVFEDGPLGVEAARNGGFDCLEVADGAPLGPILKPQD